MVAVVIPYAGGCPHRLRALDWVRTKYETLGWDTVVGEGDPDAWCKATAVANGIAQTSDKLLVIADADCWSDETIDAVRAVQAGAAWAMPHRKVFRLTPDATANLLNGVDDWATEADPYQGMIGGGIVVLPRKKYDRIPLDPRFVGWGGEDFAWGAALYTLAAGNPWRENGRLRHLWHPPHPAQPADRKTHQNMELRRRYLEAEMVPALMLPLLEEARACLSLASSTVQ